MARVKSRPAVKAPLQPGGGTSISATKQRRCARTRQDTVTSGAQGLLELQKKMKRPLLFRMGKGTELDVLFAPFARLVREITEFHAREVTRWTPEAVVYLQYLTESILEKMFNTESPFTFHLEQVTIKEEEGQEPEQPWRARKEGPSHLNQHIVTKPTATVIPASIKVKDEPSWSERENFVSKAQNIVMEAPAAASTTGKRRQGRNVKQPWRVRKEGPSHLDQHIVTKPSATVIPTSIKVKDEPSWSERENFVIKAQNIVMEAPAAASITGKRRQGRNVKQPCRARKEGPSHLDQHIVTKPAGTMIPANIEVKEEPSWSGRENFVSKAQNIVMEAPTAASTTRKRRQGRNVGQPWRARKEGPSHLDQQGSEHRHGGAGGSVDHWKEKAGSQC